MKIILPILLMLLPLAIRADEPRAQFSFTSPNGQYVFQTPNEPQNRKWSLIEKATKKVLYEITGRFHSMSVVVGDDGKNLLMIDDYSESEPESNPEVLQFFVDGKRIKAYKLSELVENPRNVEQTVSHFMWLDKPFLIKTFRFDGSQFRLSTIELVSFTFDINTGEISEKKKNTELEEKINKYNSEQNKKQKAMLRYDGFYCEPNNDGRTCLRFYKDGLVIATDLFRLVTDEQILTKVSKWFTRESGKKRSNLSEGMFKLSGATIAFITKSGFKFGPEQQFVKVEYNGSIEDSGDALKLDSYSAYNNNRRKSRRFEFVKIKH